MLLESLESRRLMSVSLSAAGVLTVTGKNDPNPANGDHINIYVSGSNLKVNDNSAVSTFQLTKVKSLVVNLRAGDDNLTIDPNVTLPSTIDSGTATSFAGDVIQGGSGPDLIYLRATMAWPRAAQATIRCRTWAASTSSPAMAATTFSLTRPLVRLKASSPAAPVPIPSTTPRQPTT